MKHTHQPDQQRAIKIINILRDATKNMVRPAAELLVKEYGRDPYLVLVSCILSLRTKDTVSWPASRRLFLRAKTVKEMLALTKEEIANIIYPCGFYRQKAQTILTISTDIKDRFDSVVPSNQKDLMSLHGVGLKTANLVLAEGFEIPALCVDVHVHRIANRLGIVQTKTPQETEQALTLLLPSEYWRECNTLFVMWGQNICVPQSPRCTVCPIRPLCERVSVIKSR